MLKLFFIVQKQHILQLMTPKKLKYSEKKKPPKISYRSNK